MRGLQAMRPTLFFSRSKNEYGTRQDYEPLPHLCVLVALCDDSRKKLKNKSLARGTS
jgi:hypothetical protein